MLNFRASKPEVREAWDPGVPWICVETVSFGGVLLYGENNMSTLCLVYTGMGAFIEVLSENCYNSLVAC